MSSAPIVLVTATTESLRGRSRVRVNEAYTNALVQAGLIPVVLPPVDPAIAADSLGSFAGLVLTGGEDIAPERFGEARHPAVGDVHAARDAYEIALAQAARERRMPTLAICRGAQVVNVALGGNLVQDIPTQRPTPTNHDQSEARNDRVHDIAVEAGSRLAGIVGAMGISVNSSHHQSIDRPAPGLAVTARSADGIVEAVEPIDDAWWMVAVQWHPEELTATPEDWDRRLFTAFAQRVAQAVTRL